MKRAVWIKAEHGSIIVEPFSFPALPFQRILAAYPVAASNFSLALLPQSPPSKTFFATVRSASKRYSLFKTEHSNYQLYTGQVLDGPVWLEIWCFPNIVPQLQRRWVIKMSKLAFPTGCCIVTPSVITILDWPTQCYYIEQCQPFCFPLYERFPPVS